MMKMHSLSNNNRKKAVKPAVAVNLSKGSWILGSILYFLQCMSFWVLPFTCKSLIKRCGVLHQGHLCKPVRNPALGSQLAQMREVSKGKEPRSSQRRLVRPQSFRVSLGCYPHICLGAFPSSAFLGLCANCSGSLRTLSLLHPWTCQPSHIIYFLFAALWFYFTLPAF